MVNKQFLLGNLGKDPEVKTFDNGDKVANAVLATSEKYKDRNGEKQEVTDWHRLVFKKTLAEIAEKYLAKGSKIYVEGKSKTRSYGEGDAKKYVTECHVYDLKMLDGKAQPQAQPQPQQKASSEPQQEDDLPY